MGVGAIVEFTIVNSLKAMFNVVELSYVLPHFVALIRFLTLGVFSQIE